MIKLAKDVARVAHKDQRRKWKDEPYINHPIEVGGILNIAFMPEYVMVAGILHDVVEDTHVTLDTIHNLFGCDVARVVSGVTNQDTPGVGRDVKLQIEIGKLKSASSDICNVRCCDIYSNCKDIMEINPSFGKIYIPEKRKIVDTIRQRVDPWILSQVDKVLIVP